MANIIGVSKFVNIFGLIIPVGVLPYPATFLATDLISEVYGRKRANFVVFIGFIASIFIIIMVTAGHFAPMASITEDPGLYEGIYGYMVRGTLASMAAYLTAQFVDVQLFHFWKRLTKGKHLWLRNNASTMTSQLVDSTAVIVFTFWGSMGIMEMIQTIFYAYIFKFFAALLDTPLAYLGRYLINKYIMGRSPEPAEVSTQVTEG
ncbi:MAG: queuosine precursor transporter [Candidatus Marinimicrobia bacterium]|nr:queuosine precursor transporter [Candidatus Neomarinimicrobiota bacterium]MCF7828410.1 queuosine precursor transporter [Candidatus Neomarinimicrobiota bacterium]MCF7880996.1 queuosine precursor transporter [Candidatus Neomarinimicrobiota bacterium]